MTAHDFLGVGSAHAHHEGGDGSSRRWSLDRRVPLVLLFMVFVFAVTNLVAMVWWAATSSKRLDYVEKAIAIAAPESAKIAGLDAKVDDMQHSLDRIERLVERGAQP